MHRDNEKLKEPLFTDAPLPGAHAPTKLNWALGVRITIGAIVIAVLAVSAGTWLALDYTHDTEQRLSNLEQYINGRTEVRDRERTEILAEIEKQREDNVLTFCSFVNTVKDDTPLVLRLKSQFCDPASR